MLSVLLESRGARERRRGGTAASVAAHAAVIAAVVVGTARGSVVSAPAKPEVIAIRVRHAPEPTAPRAPDAMTRGAAALAVPAVSPAPAPAIDLSRIPIGLPDGPLVVLRDGEAGPGPASGASSLVGDPYGGSGAGPIEGGVLTESTVERAARLLVAPAPRFPERLRALGIGGRVVVQFVVDTSGRVEPASVQVVDAAHDDFATAVRAVLPRLRFQPAEWGGRKVRMLAVMPFEFALR